MWNKLLFSPIIRDKSVAKKLAYIGICAALSIVSNMFLEFRLFVDVQFSLTIFISIFIGIIIGPISGFVACMIGDFVGYVCNSWGMLYMPWVGISTGLMALFGGIIFNNFKWNVWIKTAVCMLITFIVCTILINSLGFYLYNYQMGFSTAVINYVADKFGGNVTFFAYVCYRLIFKLQILNSAFNYVVCFVAIPFLLKIPAFKSGSRSKDE